MKIVTLVLLVILLGACATQPANFSYYQLKAEVKHGSDTDKVRDLSTTPNILLKLQVPDYLKQNKMVVQTGGNRLHFADLHLWAEIPMKSIQSVLVNELNADKADWYIVEHLKSAAQKPGYELNIDIQQLYPGDSGQAVLSGSWVFYMDGKAHSARNFHYSKNLQSDGFSHSVEMQYQLLKQLSDDIHSYFSQNLPPQQRHSKQ